MDCRELLVKLIIAVVLFVGKLFLAGATTIEKCYGSDKVTCVLTALKELPSVQEAAYSVYSTWCSYRAK
jgi:hypothetical protein